MVYTRYNSDEEIIQQINELSEVKLRLIANRKAKYRLTGDERLRKPSKKEASITKDIARLRTALSYRKNRALFVDIY